MQRHLVKSADVFHLAGGVARPLPAVEALVVLDEPLPSRSERQRCGSFIAEGQGPWQLKAKSMGVGQSLKLSRAHADAFRGACRRMGYKCTMRTDGDVVQVWIVNKPQEHQAS